MFNYIKGTITYVNGNYITLENNSIGYIIKTPNPFNFEINSSVTIYTYLHVREDAIELFGFQNMEERDFFLQLISVKGLGPKGALAILGSGSLKETIEAINNGNAKYLLRFPGIGQKASQQIILDLHGKINLNQTSKIINPQIENVKEALKSLGYNNNEIKSIIPLLEQNQNLSTSELTKLALKNISAQKH